MGFEFVAQGQAFHVAARLHRAAAAPVASRHGAAQVVALEQGADHADGEGIARPDRVHHLGHWSRGDHTFATAGIAKIRALGTQLDGHALHAVLQVEAGDGLRGLPAGEQAAPSDEATVPSTRMGGAGVRSAVEHLPRRTV